MTQYPVSLDREASKTMASFPDFPHVRAYGDDEGEALGRAVDTLETYLMGVIEDREPIPDPGVPNASRDSSRFHRGR